MVFQLGEQKPLDHSLPCLMSLVSSKCSAAYRRFKTGERKYLQPRDGMDSLRTNPYQPTFGTGPRESTQPSLTTILPYSRTPDQIMGTEEAIPDVLNLKAFKKIDVIYINEPAKIADRLEEMMNLVLTLKNPQTILIEKQLSALGNLITLIRAEARQDINIFDFEQEDRKFQDECEKLIQDLSKRIDDPQQFSEEPGKLYHATSIWRRIGSIIVLCLHSVRIFCRDKFRTPE